MLEETGIRSDVSGPESFTPDHKPLIGESSEVQGFFYNCGYNSGGVMYSGGCANEIATWIRTGSPSNNIFCYDIILIKR